MKRRHRLAGLLVATLGAALWLGTQDDPDAAGVEPVVRKRNGPAAPAEPSRSRVAARAEWPGAPAPRASEPWPFDTALAQAWIPPPPPPPPPAPASTPRTVTPAATPPQPAQPPAFPYTLIGRIEDGGAAQALLTGALRTLAVKPLDVVDGQWRVDAVEARSVVLTWLPGGQRQTLALAPS